MLLTYRFYIFGFGSIDYIPIAHMMLVVSSPRIL